MQVISNPSDQLHDDPQQIARIASSNGAFDHLAINYIADQPMGSGAVPVGPPPSERSRANMRAMRRTADPPTDAPGGSVAKSGDQV